MRAALVLVLLWAVSASAAPTLLVKGRTRVEIQTIRRTDQGVRVTGRVVEAASGAGVGTSEVALSVAGAQVLAATDEHGRFEADFALPRGEYDLEILFPGDALHEPAAPLRYRFDVGKEALELRLRAPSRVEATAESFEVVVEAFAAELPVRARVTIGIEGREIAAVDTGPDGLGQALVRRAALGGPGEKRLVARFSGDEAFNPAETSTRLWVVSDTRFDDVEAPSGEVAHEATIRVRGRLIDAEGRAVAQAAVSLWAAGQVISAAVTDRDGRFAFSVRASELAPGPVTLSVAHEPRAGWWRGARSAPIPITVQRPRQVPVRATALAVGAATLALVGFALGRTQPWRSLVVRFRRRSLRGEGNDAPRVAVGSDTPPRTGLKIARPGVLSTLRRPADLGVSGVVRDAVTGRPIAGATVVFEWAGGVAHGAASSAAPTARASTTDVEGRFEVASLEAGAWRGRATAHGYVSEGFSIAVPHRGELRGARIDLLPVRERLFALYRQVVLPLMPSADRWGIWTPREILDHVRARRPAAELAALTDFVEEHCFSARVPGEEILSDAAARARRAGVS